MAGGRGPAPKDPSKRARRNADPHPRTTVRADGKLRGPALPPADKVLAEGDEWHPMTRKWWTVWRKSPQAQAMTDTDWQEMLATALMHHAMWSKGQWTLAAEVRLRVAKFGATPEDRLRLRMQIDDPNADEEAPAESEPRTSRSRYSGLRVVGNRDVAGA